MIEFKMENPELEKIIEEDEKLTEEEIELRQIPIPTPPKDLDDEQDMARYDREMDEYMLKTTPIRARYAEIWRNNR